MNQQVTRLIMCALAALVSLSSSAEVLTCQSTAEEVRRVYDDGADQKVGDMQGNRSKLWKQSRIPAWDEPVLDSAWFMTGDYSKAQSKEINSLRSQELYLLADKLHRIADVRKVIVDRCLQKSNDPCGTQNTGPAECVAFFDQRYSSVIGRMEERQREVFASPRLGHVGLVQQLAEQELGVTKSRQVLVGEYVGSEWSPKPNELASFPLEQANFRALDRINASYGGKPALTKGEFETTAAFEERKKTKSISKATPITLSTALETEINAYNRPYIDGQSIKYDADRGAFDVVVRFFNVSFSVPMTILVSPEEAPEVKNSMLQSYGPYGDPEKLAQPWLVFALSDSSLMLKGGYLMRRVGADKHAIPMQVKGPALIVAIGNDGAKKFLPTLQAERATKFGREQLQKQAQQEQFCRNLKMSAAANNPSYYGVIVRGAGCN